MSGHPDSGSGTQPANRPTIPPYLVAADRLPHPSKLPSGDTMKTVKITEILAYYDGILAFTAQDPIGGHYVGSIIGSIIERTSENDRYLIVGARPERLDDLRNGKVDLRALLLEAPDGEWYVTVPEGTIDDPITLVPQHTRLADSVHLPGAGYFLGPEAPPRRSGNPAQAGTRQSRCRHRPSCAGQPRRRRMESAHRPWAESRQDQSQRPRPERLADRQALPLQVRGSHRAGHALARPEDALPAKHRNRLNP